MEGSREEGPLPNMQPSPMSSLSGRKSERKRKSTSRLVESQSQELEGVFEEIDSVELSEDWQPCKKLRRISSRPVFEGGGPRPSCGVGGANLGVGVAERGQAARGDGGKGLEAAADATEALLGADSFD